MKWKAVIVLLTAGCIILPVCRAAAIEGLITDLGFGAFNITAENGTELRLHESGKTTHYEPSNWRPHAGDKIYADFSEEYRNDRTVLIAGNLRLIEAGPETLLLTSPLTAIIEESGRSGYRARLPSYENQVQKFIITRDTKNIPSDWAPVPGDHVMIFFKTESARFGFGLSFIATKIEKQTP